MKKYLLAKLLDLKKNFIYRKQTGNILNHLTLSISNDEVRKSFDLHQSKKFERSVWFLIAGIAVLLLRHILYM